MSLIIIAGPAGVGKGSIVKKLLAESRRFTLSVSATTRAPRPGELDGVHYHFVDKERFAQMVAADEFIEWATVHGDDNYGTPKGELKRAKDAGQHLILEIDVQGVAQVLEKYPDALDIFIEPPSFGELEDRLRGRGTETEAQIQQRLATARRELAQAANFRHRIVNDNLDECVAKVLDLAGTSKGNK